MDKRIKHAIMDIMQNENNLEQEFVIDLLKKMTPKLDVENLKEKEYKRMANSLICSFKDETGVRDIFVITNNDLMTEYINVSRSKEVEDLNKVRTRLENNINGNKKSLKKVESRLFLIENQMSIADIARNEDAL